MKKDKKPNKSKKKIKDFPTYEVSVTIPIAEKKIKRPTEFDEKIAQEICNKVASCTDGIRKLCAENKHWPHHEDIYRWCYHNLDFNARYARAKSMQSEWLVEEAREIANNNSRDTYIDENGKEKCDHEWVARSRLRVDTVKWIASKLAPKIYGEKIQMEQKINFDTITPEQLDKLIAKMSDAEQLKLVEEIVNKHEAKKSQQESHLLTNNDEDN